MSEQHAESVAHDWKAEASGLAYMICQIAKEYRYAKAKLGGDSEFLASAIFQAEKYCDGPMLDHWHAEQTDGPGPISEADDA